jgi:hypothetical protein
MALSHSPQIVRDGLVLYLDPANIKSYPESGTTFFDLSKNTDATLINGALISNNRIILDGINDYINTNRDIDLSGSITYEFVLKVDAVTANKVLFGKYGGSGTGSDMWIGIRTDLQRLTAGFYSLNSTFSVTDNQLRHYTITYNSVTGATVLYINGELNFNSSVSARTNPVGNLMIGKFGIASTFYFPGELGFVKIYNTALTGDQVKQNFNATRGRYGI